VSGSRFDKEAEILRRTPEEHIERAAELMTSKTVEPLLMWGAVHAELLMAIAKKGTDYHPPIPV
jgi:hypothetical protein